MIRLDRRLSADVTTATGAVHNPRKPCPGSCNERWEASLPRCTRYVTQGAGTLAFCFSVFSFFLFCFSLSFEVTWSYVNTCPSFFPFYQPSIHHFILFLLPFVVPSFALRSSINWRQFFTCTSPPPFFLSSQSSFLGSFLSFFSLLSFILFFISCSSPSFLFFLLTFFPSFLPSSLYFILSVCFSSFPFLPSFHPSVYHLPLPLSRFPLFTHCLFGGADEEQDPASHWLGSIARGTMHTYNESIFKLHELTRYSTQQLLADMGE